MVKIQKRLERIVEEWHNIRRPFAKYTTAQTIMNGIIMTCQTGDICTATSDAIKNLPFIATTNLVYAKGVDYITRKLGIYGRLGANIFSLGVTGAFYAYGTLTNDNDPTIPSVIAGAIGLYLTNKQVTHIQSDIIPESPYFYPK